jgi:Xaa-Pro aminopeptidase
MVDPKLLEAMLRNWAQLNIDVMQMEEDSVLALLELEKAGRARLRTMLRIYNRLSKLRSIREKRELAQVAKG